MHMPTTFAGNCARFSPPTAGAEAARSRATCHLLQRACKLHLVRSQRANEKDSIPAPGYGVLPGAHAHQVRPHGNKSGLPAALVVASKQQPCTSRAVGTPTWCSPAEAPTHPSSQDPPAAGFACTERSRKLPECNYRAAGAPDWLSRVDHGLQPVHAVSHRNVGGVCVLRPVARLLQLQSTYFSRDPVSLSYARPSEQNHERCGSMTARSLDLL